jgi:GT2 family glycosyltransferase
MGWRLIMLDITNLRLGIGIPLSFPYVPSAFFGSFSIMEKPKIYELIIENSGPIDHMRNNLVKRAMASGCSHLIMMDTDQIYHPQTITKLLAHNLPIVSCVVHRRYPPFDPLLFRSKDGDKHALEPILEFKQGDLLEIGGTGTGCMLVSMEVFYGIKEPWFSFNGIEDDELGTVMMGEDFHFCWKARDAGFKLYADTSLTAGHLSTFEVNRATWKWYGIISNRQNDALRELEEKQNILPC